MNHHIKAVNICEKHANQCSHVLHDQEIQFEFPFCESMPELLVKNLLVNAREIDVNSISYAESPVIPHVVHNRGMSLHVLRRQT